MSTVTDFGSRTGAGRDRLEPTLDDFFPNGEGGVTNRFPLVYRRLPSIAAIAANLET